MDCAVGSSAFSRNLSGSARKAFHRGKSLAPNDAYHCLHVDRCQEVRNGAELIHVHAATTESVISAEGALQKW
jgi:hypothetical protein